MRHVTTGVEISASADRVWARLARYQHWPEWGSSIRSVKADAAEVEVGARGLVQTVAGVWLPFVITDVEPGQSWTWDVAGVPATTHLVVQLGAERCRVEFSVAWPFAPYVLVLRDALGRLKRSLEP